MSLAARFRRPLVVIGVVVAATALAAVTVPRGGHTAQLRARAEAGEEHEATRVIHGAICGFERWPVKTLSDPQARELDYTPHPATVRYLGSLPARPGGQDSRGALETRTFTVQARLVAVKREADSDYHLVLAADGATIIAEMPLVGCTPNTDTQWRPPARSWSAQSAARSAAPGFTPACWSGSPASCSSTSRTVSTATRATTRSYTR